MKILLSDSVVDMKNCIEIVESRSGTQLTVRYPDQENLRERKDRSEVRPLAELIHFARTSGKALQLGRRISLRGD